MISTDNRKCCFQVQIESIQVSKVQVKFPTPVFFVATVLHTRDALYRMHVTERGVCTWFTFLFRDVPVKLLEEARKTLRSDTLQQTTNFCNHYYVVLF